MISFSTALSGLKASETAVDVTGNNLANLNTTGYKSSSTLFSDMMALSLGSGNAQVGLGVGAPETVRDFSQGPIQSTKTPLDAAIQGSGFFMTTNSAGQTLYTRDGSFTMAKDGSLVTQTGEQVLGWTAVNGVVNTNASVGPIVLNVGALSNAVATTKVSFNANLNSDGTAAASTDTFSVPVSIVDSKGATHTMTIKFTKDATANTWDYAVTVPAADGTVSSGGTGTLSFGTDGKLNLTSGTSDTIKITGLTDSAADMSITWNWADSAGDALLTQLSATSSFTSLQQDGQEPSGLDSVKFGDNGQILATYTNGVQELVGQVAIASITNPDTMVSVGNNSYLTTADTAPPNPGVAGTGGRGQVLGSSLEGSNVDIASEFTNLIVYQRGYQANAKVITAANELSQTTIGLIS